MAGKEHNGLIVYLRVLPPGGSLLSDRHKQCPSQLNFSHIRNITCHLYAALIREASKGIQKDTPLYTFRYPFLGKVFVLLAQMLWRWSCRDGAPFSNTTTAAVHSDESRKGYCLGLDRLNMSWQDYCIGPSSSMSYLESESVLQPALRKVVAQGSQNG